jgi:hypothetical protein
MTNLEVLVFSGSCWYYGEVMTDLDGLVKTVEEGRLVRLQSAVQINSHFVPIQTPGGIAVQDFTGFNSVQGWQTDSAILYLKATGFQLLSDLSQSDQGEIRHFLINTTKNWTVMRAKRLNLTQG